MRKHIDRIDVLRGMAILLVFFYHAQLVLFPNFATGLGTLNTLLRFSPFAYGGTGVQLFLLISGFLIHYSHLASDKSFSFGKFINRRFWRIYPPYLFFLFLFFFTKEQLGSFDLMLHLLMGYNFTDATIFQVNSSFWSLALEWQLYLLYPVYRFLLAKMNPNKTIVFIGFLAFVFIVCQYVFEIKSSAFDFNPLKYWIIWVAGAHLAAYYHKGKRLIEISGRGILVLLAITVLLANIPILSHLYFYLFTFFYLLFMDWFLHADTNTERPAFKILIHVGMVSYSLYLFHQPFLWEAIDFFRFGFYSFLITVPLVLSLFIGLATLTYRFLEKPSVGLGRRFDGRFFKS